MQKPWLSVIVSSHDGERWLGTALQSIVNQQDDGIEVIVIDASATEASLEIAHSFCDRLNIRVERRLELRPWTAKTNFGVAQARSNQICILHQDDVWQPNRCAELRQWLSSKPDAVMHLHPSYIIDERGRQLGLWRCPLRSDGSPVPSQTLFERLLVQNFIAIPSPTIRRDTYLSVGGLDTQLWYTPDWDLYLKIATVGNIYYHSKPLASFRIHKNSLTVSGSGNISDFRQQHQIVVDRYAAKLQSASRDAVLRCAQASIDVNTALAAAIHGEFHQIQKALGSLLLLGPAGIYRYFSCSRILDRALPRLRALARRSF
jgi:glycosyltransferase involved in cell wall biosynthesis